jgi:hypothetical protein
VSRRTRSQSTSTCATSWSDQLNGLYHIDSDIRISRS